MRAVLPNAFSPACAVLVVIIALLAFGCAGNNSSDAFAKAVDVEVGMTQSQVLSIMGEPQRRETHGGTEFLIYPIGTETALLHFMPIAIVDGRVTGIGRGLYDNVVRSKAQSDLTRNQHDN